MDQAQFTEPVDQVNTYYSVYTGPKNIDYELRAYQWLHYSDYTDLNEAQACAQHFGRYQIVRCDWLYSGTRLHAIRGQIL